MAVQNKLQKDLSSEALAHMESESAELSQGDDDIDQIIDEIEELQQEMDAQEASDPADMSDSPGESPVEPTVSSPQTPPPRLKITPPAPPAASESESDDIIEEFRTKGEDASIEAGLMEETLGNLKPEASQKPTFLDQSISEQSSDEEPVKESETMMDEEETLAGADDGVLTMTLTGKLTLRLKYEHGGQEVTLGFTDRFLQVVMDDGTEFKIPVRRGKRPKVA